jgi:hypothetical protein
MMREHQLISPEKLWACPGGGEWIMTRSVQFVTRAETSFPVPGSWDARNRVGDRAHQQKVNSTAVTQQTTASKQIVAASRNIEASQYGNQGVACWPVLMPFVWSDEVMASGHWHWPLACKAPLDAKGYKTTRVISTNEGHSLRAAAPDKLLEKAMDLSTRKGRMPGVVHNT